MCCHKDSLLVYCHKSYYFPYTATNTLTHYCFSCTATKTVCCFTVTNPITFHILPQILFTFQTATISNSFFPYKTLWPSSTSELYRQGGRLRSAKLVPTFADRGVSRGHRNGSPRSLISVFWTGAATFYSSSSSVDLTRLSGPRSRPTTTQKIW